MKSRNMLHLRVLSNIFIGLAILLTPLAFASEIQMQINPESRLHLIWVTGAQTITAGEVSGIMTLQVQDSGNNPVNVSGNIPISLSTSSLTTGSFSINHDGPFAGPKLTLLMEEGSDSISFYYKDTDIGAVTIVPLAIDQRWVCATQDQMILPRAPRVGTLVVSDVGMMSAKFNGTIIEEGVPPIIQKGFVWGTGPLPVITESQAVQGNTDTADSFNAKVTGLRPSQTYYVRSYAVSLAGTVYGEAVSFTTQEASLRGIFEELMYLLRVNLSGLSRSGMGR